MLRPTGFSSCSLKNMFLNEPIKKNTHTCTLHILYVSPSAVLAPPAHPASRFCNYPPIFHLCHSIPTHPPAGKASILVFHGPPPLHIHMSLPVFCLFSVSIHRGKLSQTFFILLSSASQLSIFFLHFSVPFPPNFLTSIYICAPFFVTLLHICGETALLFFFYFHLFTLISKFKKKSFPDYFACFNS